MSFLTFKNGQETGTEFIALLGQVVFQFVYTSLLRRNSEVTKMSSDSESNSFNNLLSSSDEDIIISSFRPYWFDL